MAGFDVSTVTWVLIATALIYFMQAGFALCEAGLTRAKNTGNILMKNMMDFCIGTPCYLYRAYKDGVSEYQIDLLKEKLYYGTAARADITRITRRLGDDIAKVYGFSIPRQRQSTELQR